MVMIMKKLQTFLVSLSMFSLLPLKVLAYSDKVMLGGENVGIHIDMTGVMVIGFYKVDGENLRGNPSIQIGDYILKVNDKEITSIDDLTRAIEKEIKDNKVVLTVRRGTEDKTIEMSLKKQDGVYKTGLYVKDGITGLGTISYIDPETKVYGALGHEIIESNSSKVVEVKTGNIFESTVTSIRKSSEGNAGEKNAKFNFNHIYGDIKNNTNHGIFGIYKESVDRKTISVGNPSDIKKGKATIVTVLSGSEKKYYDINITNIENKDTKNLTFEITDQELINKTGGVIQGMSGSPIVQDDKIIGAVTHVIVDHPLKGYGIFITTMLKEGDKIL